MRPAVPVILVAFMVAAALPASGQDSPGISVRAYPLLPHGTLRLPVARSWRDSVTPATRDYPHMITFTPDAGDAFHVLVSVFRPATGDPFVTASTRLRRSVEEHGKRALPLAVETRLVVQELRGQEVIGYFYTLTDKVPKPGDYPAVMQGMFALGDLLVTFTVQSHEAGDPAASAALDMLRGASVRPSP